jgi:hypothetical protein
MKRYKTISIAALGLLVLALALACAGTGTPVPMSDIPVYPGATSMDAADDPVASVLLESMEEAAAEEPNVDAEFEFYTLPSGTTLKDLKDFYIGELKDTDWKPSDDLTIDEDVFHMFGWERSKQAVSVGFVPEELSGSPLMLIMLATEK